LSFIISKYRTIEYTYDVQKADKIYLGTLWMSNLCPIINMPFQTKDDFLDLDKIRIKCFIIYTKVRWRRRKKKNTDL